MEFEKVFADLEIQLMHDVESEIETRVLEEERQRLSRLTLRQRIVNLSSARPVGTLTVSIRSGHRFEVLHTRVGKDWWAVEMVSPEEFSGDAIIPLASISTIELPPAVVMQSLGTPVGQITEQEFYGSGGPGMLDRISVGFLLRDIARRRKQATVMTTTGRYVGMIDRVGADHLDLTTTAHTTVMISLAEIGCVLLEKRV